MPKAPATGTDEAWYVSVAGTDFTTTGSIFSTTVVRVGSWAMRVELSAVCASRSLLQHRAKRPEMTAAPRIPRTEPAMVPPEIPWVVMETGAAEGAKTGWAVVVAPFADSVGTGAGTSADNSFSSSRDHRTCTCASASSSRRYAADNTRSTRNPCCGARCNPGAVHYSSGAQNACSARDNAGLAAIVCGSIIDASGDGTFGSLGECCSALARSVLGRVAEWVGESTAAAVNETINVSRVLLWFPTDVKRVICKE